MTVHFRPAVSGGWLALASGETLLVIAAPADQTTVDALWGALGSAGGFQRVLDVLTNKGLAATPPFALFDGAAASMRVIVRGPVVAKVTDASGVRLLDGGGVTTWLEQTLVEVSSLSVEVVGSVTAEGVVQLPLATGAAWVSALELGVSKGLDTAAGGLLDQHTAAGGLLDQQAVVEIDPEATVTEAPTERNDAPDPAPNTPADGYDYLFGATMFRDVAAAAVQEAPADDEAAPEPAGDHDGHTVLTSDIAKLRAQRKAKRGASTPTPAAPAARVFLALSSGTREPLTQPILVGRSPSVSQVSGGQMPRLLTVGTPDQDISRTHVRFVLEGGTHLGDHRHRRRPRRRSDPHCGRSGGRSLMRRASSSPPELPGYTFIKVLGSGGFSDVFLYEQKLPKRRVAVKVLLTEELSGANRAAFVAEANLMAQLSTHPYIVTIYQADVAGDDRPYFVMEYCSGPSLAERYKQETFPVVDALRTGVRLSSAVATAHAAGILHRDIKPGNVLTNDYGWPALTDFGISSAVEDDVLPIHTGTLADALAQDTGSGGTGQSVGMSVPWSPPEMFEDDPEPDVRSDVFSLAATIYTILAGQTPFEVRGHSNGTLDLIGRIERGAITPMARDDIPRSLLAVLQKGMASNRSDRFSTAVDFARALQRVELELGYSPTTIDVPNLHIEAPSRGSQADDADETRARSVATIQAQPVAAPGVPPLVTAPPASLDETQVRGAPKVIAQPEPASETVVRRRVSTPVEPATGIEEPQEPAATRAMSRTNKILIGVAGGAVLVIAGLIVAGLALGGGPTDVATPSPKQSGDSAIVETVPVPTLVGAPAVTGTDLVFTAKNPKPATGDSFRWRISNRGSDEALHQSTDGVVTVSDYTAGSPVCVEITVARAGKLSDPLEACYPE